MKITSIFSVSALRHANARKAYPFLIIISLVISLLAIQGVFADTTTIFNASFNSGMDGFIYLDDPFGTSQPAYASGTHTSSAGYGGTGGLQVNLGGVDSSTINGMSGGWQFNFNLGSAESSLLLSFRYRLSQSAAYEYDEYSQIRVLVDGNNYGRGAKSYVDQIGGDGSSSQGYSSSYLPTTEWQQAEIYLGDLSSGSHTITLGSYNNQKNASDESTILLIDDVILTSGNPVPPMKDSQALVNRLDQNQYKAYNQGIAQFNDRCRLSGCSSTDYYNALAWVESQLQAMGYNTVRHNFNYNGNTGTNLWATKVGTTNPTQMYMISTHLDGRGGGDAYDDDGSGVALVMEAARVLSGPDVQTDKSVRFIFWDKEEVGLYGAYGYVQDRRSLQGSIDEPTWLGLIQHDMILYDHGAGTPGAQQSIYADLDVEWRAGTTKEADSKALAIAWRYYNSDYATDYPANAYNYSTNTDDTPFHPYVASVSVRENRRSLTSYSNAEWINPYYHQTTDIESSYSSQDTLLGFNAVQTTLGTIAELAGAMISVPPTPSATPTETPLPTDTPLPTATNTPLPTDTPLPTATDTPLPTNTPLPTATDTPLPTNTPLPTATDTPLPTNTPLPTATDTPVPTDTPLPTATDTPLPTNTPLPTATDTPLPTGTSTPTPTQPAYIDYIATSEIPVGGTITGSYFDTHQNDGAFEAIQERQSGGKPSSRYSYLEHKWIFSIQPGTTVTFNANVWAPTSSDGDSFVFAYSTDDTNYVEMFTVSQSLDDDSYQFFTLPTSISGTVYIQVIDSNQGSGNLELDTVYIDHMYIRTVIQPGNPPDAPGSLSATAISASQIDLTWVDNSTNELGFKVERSVSAGPFSIIATLGPDSTSWSDAELTANTTYSYRIFAYNTSGNSNTSNTASATTEAGSNIHIGDLDGTSTLNRNKWDATVMVTVHDQNHNPIAGALVTGIWSDGAVGEGSCFTNDMGMCEILKSGNKSNVPGVTFTVSGVTLSGYTYNPASNHDPDGDSNGTTIRILMP